MGSRAAKDDKRYTCMGRPDRVLGIPAEHKVSARGQVHGWSRGRAAQVLDRRPFSHIDKFSAGRMMPNPLTSLDAAMTCLFHSGRRCRGASEFFRSP